MTARSSRTFSILLCALAACSTPPVLEDASGDRNEASVAPDANTAPSDANTTDASVLPTDASAVSVDANTMPTDASGMPTDASAGCPPPGPTNANTTTPGEITTPNPTLRNVAIEWAITGDANENSVVRVRFRPMGAGAFREAMPLRRVPAGSTSGRSWTNRHSGSIFDLEPDTTYEVELSLLDPDGGCASRTVTVRTRPVPVVPAGATVRAVNAGTFAMALASANPGDVLELAAGNYTGFTLTRDGATGRPITLRSTAGAVITGNVELIGRRDVRLEGLTIRGRVRLNNGRSIALVRNTIETTGDGVVAFLRAEDCYIADNTVRGASQWTVAAFGVSGSNVGEGIVLTGPGHVIEHNRVTGFRDGISFMEDAEAVDQWSIDVVENDIDNAGDDGIEADFCAHNCRVVRNRITNAFMAMSSQPSLGGPTYFLRNAAYNVIVSAFKLQRSSVGDVLLHNTVVKNGDAFGIYTSEPVARAYSRNNLFVGGPGAMFGTYSSGTGRVIDVSTAQASCDFDYDGFGSTVGMFAGRLGAARFASLAELRAMTTERHAVSVELATVFATSVSYPAAPVPALAAPDLRVRPGGSAIDVGIPLPNVNDGFAGGAPDLGAYEAGSALPAYGPRR